MTYGYNANGQVTSLTLNGSSTLLSGITYDPFGPITGWTWGNGTTASRDFDADGKVTQLDNANGVSLETYAYDDAFRITGISDALDPVRRTPRPCFKSSLSGENLICCCRSFSVTDLEPQSTGGH